MSKAGPYTIEVYRKDGTRFESHHCDGTYGMSSDLWTAVSEATNDEEVGEVRIIKRQS